MTLACLDDIIEVAKTSDNADHTLHAVMTLSNLTSFETSQQELKEKGIDVYLSHLHATTKDPNIRRELAQSLAELGQPVAGGRLNDDRDMENDVEDDDDESRKSVKEELKNQIKVLVDRLEKEKRESELEKITSELFLVLQQKYELTTRTTHTQT